MPIVGGAISAAVLDRLDGALAVGVPPFVVLVKFDRYTGPVCFPGDPALEGVVPIFRSKRDFLKGRENCSRTQFPLTIASAITVHKSQGATLDKVVLDISGKDFQPDLTYVAVSRVKTLQGIVFDAAFDLSDLRLKEGASHEARDENTVRRMRQRVSASQPAQLAQPLPGPFQEHIYNS